MLLTPSRLVSSLALVLLLAVTPARTQPRVVAVGDVHGNADGLAVILQAAGLLDDERRWSGGTATLVQTGDMIDRGAQSRGALDLLMRLEAEASAAGGEVVVLLGNHEVMNMLRDLRYVTPEIYATFADERSEERRRQAYDEWIEWASERPGGGAESEEAKAQWMLEHPPGYFAYVEAFDPDGVYGRWLRAKSVIARIGDTLFLHGGLNPALPLLDLDARNSQAAEELRLYDRTRQHLVDIDLIPSWATLQEAVSAVRSLLRLLRSQPERASTLAEETVRALRAMGNIEQWSIVNENGPLWFRGFAQWAPDQGGPLVTQVLEHYGAARLVVGHTPLQGFRIVSRFDDRVFLIDTGMLESRYPGGRPSALELIGPRATAIYTDQRQPLVSP